MRKLLLALLLVLVVCGGVSAWPWDDTIYYQKITFSSVAVNKNTADLGEITAGPGAVVLWWMVEASASTDYDVLFFSEDDSTWDVDTAAYKDKIEQIYVKSTITSSWYKDDTVFPFVSTDGNGILYVGIYNDDDSNASTFEISVMLYARKGLERAVDAN